MEYKKDQADREDNSSNMLTSLEPTARRESIIQDKEIITQERISYLWKVFR